MRLALLSDIHGNYTALQAVLEDVRRHGADSIICLGDVATSGPQPKQVIAEMQKIGCPCVMGNHDQALLEPNAAPQLQIAEPLIPALHWCAEQLTPPEFDYLRKFLPTLEVSLGGKNNLLCYHGSPQSNIENIFSTTPAEQLNFIFAGRAAELFAGGHTHLQMLRQYFGTWVVNPGSVGQPFRNTPQLGTAPTLLPWAEYAIVECTERSLSVDLRRVDFDIDAYIQAISESDTPLREWLLEQYS